MDTFSKAKGLFDVVTGGNITGQTGAMIWKYPHNMVTSGSILQVMPGQEAVFYKSGSSGFEVLGPGEYPVDSKLIPFLHKLMNVPFSKKTPYTTHIWFINKTTQFNFPWGTRDRVKLEDPKFEDVVLKMGATGTLQIEVLQTEILFEKMVGTMKEFTLEDLRTALKDIVINDISGILQRFAIALRAEELKKENVDERRSFIDLLGENNTLSAMIKESLLEHFERYGIGIVNCASRLTVDENDPNYELVNSYAADRVRAVRAAKIEAETRKIAAEARRGELDVHQTYLQDRQMDALNTLSANEGNIGAVAGLGAGLGVMGAVAGQMQNVIQPMPAAYPPHGQPPYPPQGYAAPQPPQQPPAPQISQVACPSCGVAQAPAKFCNECGAAMGKKCPGCGVTVEGSPKFCNECGSPMAKKCPGCGEAIEGSPKFCNECGTKL